MKSTVSRRIKDSDVEEIARLVGTRFLNEKEACAMIGLKQDAWYQWKQRSKSNLTRYEQLINKLKSAKVNLLINRIEDASDPTKVKRADWRAASWLGERLKPEALSLQAAHSSLPVPASALDTSRLIDAMTRVYATQPVAVIECQSTKDETRTTGEQAGPMTGYASTPPPRRR